MEMILTLRLEGGLRGNWTSWQRRRDGRGVSWRQRRSGITWS